MMLGEFTVYSRQFTARIWIAAHENQAFQSARHMLESIKFD